MEWRIGCVGVVLGLGLCMPKSLFLLPRQKNECQGRRQDSIKEIQNFEDVTSLDEPFVLRGAAKESKAMHWDLDWLAASPRGNLYLDYFSDASKRPSDGGLVPDLRAPLHEIASELKQSNATTKLATEKIIRAFPELLNDLPLESIGKAFGSSHFQASRLGYSLTAPIFVGNTFSGRARTDLHAEPIANLAFQLKGSKRWTIIPPNCLPDPIMVAQDGRAYLASALDPDAVTALPSALSVTLFHGDALFLPTFWWHRVDYVHDDSNSSLSSSTDEHQRINHTTTNLALGISLFHFRPRQLFLDSGLYPRIFFLALLPNIFKEIIGWNTQ